MSPRRGWRHQAWLVGVAVVFALAAARGPLAAGDPTGAIEYRLSVPAPDQHWLGVELTLTDLPAVPLELHMSRSSPGRYALHNFISAVSHLDVLDAAGRPLAVTGPDAAGWTVPAHPSTVRVRYRVRGDRVDGTYLGVDATHAHINMPAAILWAKGQDRRPIRVTFEPPAGSGWRVATQLLPTASPLAFTAPNLQYLMDSPSELSTFTTRSFVIRDATRSATFRLALHHAGTAADADAYAGTLERLAGEATAVFGALPAFESPEYTFITDYLPTALGDGMEHRNSTVLTSGSSLASAPQPLAEKAAHEVFHAWNIERIRPQTLEPFDFDRANVSGELWLGEGVTNYYGRLLGARAGITPVEEVMAALGDSIDQVAHGAGRQRRSVVEMSRLAAVVDGASPEAKAGIEGGFLSYYTWGEVIGLALDLSLRERSQHAVSLDTLMQALWQRFGAPQGEPGYVVRGYGNDDVETTLAEVSGDEAFARNFMERYVRGRDVPDFASLVAPAGFVLQDRGAARKGVDEPARLALVPASHLTPAQRAFREQWMGPHRPGARN